MDTNTLLLSVLFGAVGLGLFVYGKKAERIPPLAAGIGLMVCPYFIPNVIALAVVGALLIAAPFVIARL